MVLLGNDAERFVETLAVARRTRSIIWQNFAALENENPVSATRVKKLGCLRCRPLLRHGILSIIGWSFFAPELRTPYPSTYKKTCHGA